MVGLDPDVAGGRSIVTGLAMRLSKDPSFGFLGRAVRPSRMADVDPRPARHRTVLPGTFRPRGSGRDTEMRCFPSAAEPYRLAEYSWCPSGRVRQPPGVLEVLGLSECCLSGSEADLAFEREQTPN
jgi:hypothetical protein